MHHFTERTAAPDVPALAWPAIPLAEWQDTRDTLHLWTQVVGTRGLSTSLIPYRDGRGFEIELDFLAHVARISVTDGSERSVVLPYEVARAAPDPDAAILDFFQSSYLAAAERANWDRTALERPPTP